MGGRLLHAAVLAGDVRAALTLAATRRGDGTLTTAHVLVEIMQVDRDASGWARISLHGRSFEQIDPTQWLDSDGESPATWEDVPLSAELAVALEVAARLVDDYGLVPMPTVALVLGLIANPGSGAARALVEGTGRTHAELVDLVQDSLAGSRLESLDLRRRNDREPDPPASRHAAVARRRPRSGAPRDDRRGLWERWDWQRVKSLVAGLALVALGVGDAVMVATPGEIDATGISRILVYLLNLVFVSVCLFYGVRQLRRAADSQAVTHRRRAERRRYLDRARAERRRDLDRARPAAAQAVSPSLGDSPTHTEQLLEVLRMATANAAASGAVTTRQHVVAVLSEGDELPAPGADTARPAHIVLDPDGARLALTVSGELAACLGQCERLAQAYAMPLVGLGHLATALAYSVLQDLEDARSRLRRYFGDDFVGLEEVLVAGTAELPAARRAAPASLIQAPPPTTGMGRSWWRSFVRVSYLGCALLLLWPLGGFLADTPQLLTDAGALHQGVRLLQAGQNDEAYRLFLEIHRRRPDSHHALAGMACAAARAGDLDRWAVSTQDALASGMPYRGAGTCLRPAQTGGFHLVVVGRIAILVPSAPPPGHLRPPGWSLAAVRSATPVAEVASQASCTAGRAGLPRYATGQARSALRIAHYSLADPSRVASKLRSCLQDWPPSQGRDAVTRWVAKS
jgi:hypothetical protein